MKIVTKTAHKIIIRWDKLDKALTPEEIQTMNQILFKLVEHDKKSE